MFTAILNGGKYALRSLNFVCDGLDISKRRKHIFARKSPLLLLTRLTLSLQVT